PAVLTPTDLTVSQPFVAGGTGAFSLTVTNTGQQDSAPDVPMDITLPAGVSVQSVDVAPGASGLRRAAVGYTQARAPAQCLPTGAPTCSVPLGVVAPNATVIVTITVDVDAGVQPDTTTTATATVSIFGVAISTTIQPDQIQTGISKLTASPDGPYFAPSTTALGITATPRDGVTKRGPLIFVLTGDTAFSSTPANCSAVGAAPIQQITCSDTGPQIAGLTLEIGADQPAGPIPLTVTDAGRRIVAVTDPPQVVPMELSTIRTGAIVAGGSQTASLDVTNNGNVPSPATPIGLTLPDGVHVASIDTGDGTCPPTADVPCLLPPVDPGSSTTVTLNLTADPSAPSGGPDLAVSVAGRSRSTPLTVDGPVLTIVATPPSPYPAGSPTSIDLHIATRSSVVTPVALTLTLGGDVSFGNAPAGCDPVEAAPTHQFVCTVTPVTGSALISGLALNIPEQATGPLPLTVADAGGRQIEVLDEFGNPLEVAPPATLDLSKVSTDTLTAGGNSGKASLTVTNIGGVASTRTPISATVTDVNDATDTVAVTGIKIGDVDCDPAAQTCELPPLAHDQQLTVTLQLSATPKAASPTLTVDIGGAEQTAALAIVTGIDTLQASPDGPYLAPSTTSMTITLTPKPGVADAGRITLTLTGESTRFISSASGCTAVGEEGSSQITCDGPGISGLGLKITAGQPAGPLPLTVTDAGSRIVVLTDSTDRPLEVTPGPAVLGLDIQDDAGLPAGGTGSIAVTATNGGGAPSAAAPINYAFPTGVTVTGIDIDGVACATAEQDACILPPVGLSAPRIVTFQLAALPEAITGDAIVTIGGTHDKATLTVDTGIAGLQASPNGPYFAPSTTVLDIAVAPVNGVANPGPLTFTLTGDVAFAAPPAGCTKSTADPTHQVTCGVNPIGGLTLAISREQISGPLPLTVTDAGGRDVTAVLKDAADNDLTVQGGPPALSMTSLPAEPLYSGGTGSASFGVRNDGGLPSEAAPIVFVPPTDVEVTSVQTGGTSCVPTPASPCQLTPVAAGSSTVVTVNLTAAPAATGGRLTATVGDASAFTELVVNSGVTGVAVSPSSPYVAPSTTRLTVQAGYQQVVTNPGQVTLTLTGGVRFTAVPPACTPTGPPGDLAAQPTQQVSCGGATINGLDLTIDKGQQAGLLPLTVTDAAGRRVEVKDDKDHDLEVVPAAPAHLTLTPIGPLTFTAGTTGTVAMTVTNDGGQLSDPAPITGSTTAGIDVTSVAVDGAVCTPGDCMLPGLEAGKDSTIDVAVDVPPSGHDGEFTVNVGAEPDTASVTVESGVATLQAGPGGPYAIGSTAVITVTATPRVGVGKLGQIALEPTGPGLEFRQTPSGCQPQGSGGLLCDGPVIDSLTMKISADASPGPLPLRAIDAGGRTIALTSTAGDELAIVQPGPAVLVLSDPAVSDPAFAGGRAAMTVTVTNSGE
ncbi:MAG TPA: hypothetical protein VES60_12030, partial [Nakamurella sp.]|nr:hypothetical protein [Nakamurella sp.]